jgi:site-specific recombinase XerD
MLRQGGDLVEIGQVLRHRDLASTSVYAKLDRVALRSVAQPWPGAVR